MSRTRNLAHATNDYGPLERLILQTLRQVGRLSRQSLSTLTGPPINAICGRVKHLIDEGQIEVCGVERNGDSGKLNELVRVVRKKRGN
ncbi:MAG: hypothetical protein KBA75_10385 [Alphaproteobacteria bacterium]|nr:hypothetical protein [Alphaproteobacteria bacterium]